MGILFWEEKELRCIARTESLEVGSKVMNYMIQLSGLVLKLSQRIAELENKGRKK